MLLRSASTPILKSCVKDSIPEALSKRASPLSPCSDSRIPAVESIKTLPRTSSEADLKALSSPKIKALKNGSIKKISRTSSETDLKALASPKVKALINGFSNARIGEAENQENGTGMGVGLGLLLNPCLDESMVRRAGEKWALPVGGDGGSGVGGSGGNCGGGGGANRDEGNEYSSSGHGYESTDQYYQKMIKANPGDPLFLGNYARFLKEVVGDHDKAQEYCERAILAEANDANVFSLYGDLIWNSHRDASRAHSYFDQAVQAAPDDSHVLASYARFLWDAVDEEEENEINIANVSATNFSLEFATTLAAAS